MIAPADRFNRLALLGPALLALMVQCSMNLTGGYGIFRDELYYIACSRHMSWGYVDQPPFSIAVLFLSRSVFGDSLFAIRLFPALLFPGLVIVSGLIAREMGSRSRGMLIASTCALTAPVYLSIFNFYSMNAFDIFFWSLAIYTVVRIINTGNGKLWLWFGVITGLGLENKLSMLFFGFALVIAMALTEHRRHFAEKWLWIGGGIALLLFLPNILWQISNQWPTVEFMRNATEHKNAPISALQFFLGQILLSGPLNLLVWIPGLFFLLLAKQLRPYRVLGFVYLLLFLLFVLQNGKVYYLSPVYPALFASGGMALDAFFDRIRAPSLSTVSVIVLLLGGIVAAPLALPILPPEQFIRYAKTLGVEPGGEERDRPSPLGQHFADMFGWRELAEEVARVYRSLPAEDRSRAGIYAQNYGEAGAIDFFGKSLGLPNAISAHNSYWYWGTQGYTGEVFIIVGSTLEENSRGFETCSLAAVHRHPYARSFESELPIFVCRNLRKPIQEVWAAQREFI